MKPLASPFLWLVALQGAALAWWWWRRRPLAAPADRRVVATLGASWMALVLLSLAPVADLIGASLGVADSAPAEAPDVIFVLGDGLQRGATLADDRVTKYEWDRVRLAAAWWRERRTARIVLSGRSQAADRAPERLGELARSALVAAGVNESAITIEPRSRSTWENVTESLRMPGITHRERAGIVTSDWHMRRARGAFDGAFADLQWRSVHGGVRDFRWYTLLPDPGVLEESGAYVKEWVGIVGYALRRVVTSP